MMFGNPENEPKNPTWTNKNWLKSRFHFSFAEYHSRHNSQFGVLRVMNDDLVQPARGFGTHPHGDMEIATYVVDGALTHKDSMGTAETLGRGAVQFMTAGTGVRHSEHNLDKNAPLRFIQMWIVPRRRGLTPNYGSACTTEEDRKNKFFHLVGDVADVSSATPKVRVNQDVNIHVAEIEPATSTTFSLGADRQAYVLCVEGEKLLVQSDDAKELATLSRHDGAEAHGPVSLVFTPKDTKGHVLIVEMAENYDGRTDL